MKEDKLKELLENITQVILNECGLIHFIREYMELIPEGKNFIILSRLLMNSEKNLIGLTEKIEEYETL